MEYTKIGPEDKKAVVEQRLGQLEAEHYSQSLTLKQLQSQDDGSEAVKKAIESTLLIMSNLDVAHGLLAQELDAFKPAEVASTNGLTP